MRAVVHDRYGPPEVLRLEEVERPEPFDRQVLVRVHATTVNRTDCGLRSADLPITRFVTGLRKPKNRILGMEFAGEVEKVGNGSHRVQGRRRGLRGQGLRRSCRVRLRPRGRTNRAQAGQHELRRGGRGPGRRSPRPRMPPPGRCQPKGAASSIYGASGSVGTAAVQLAKHFGARVTAVTSTKHAELVRSLGADEVIDYTKEDFTKNGKTYDVIFDAVGKHSFRRCRRSLKPGGTFLETDLGYGFHVPLLLLLHEVDRKQEGEARDHPLLEGRTSSSSRSSSRPGSTALSSIAPTRSRTSSRRRSTSRPARRPAMSF